MTAPIEDVDEVRGAARHVAAAVLALAFASPVEAQDRPSVAPKNMQAIAPGLAGYTDDVLFGDVWLRPDLSPRDRSLVTLSVLVSTGKTAQLSSHLGRGLDNGIKPDEVAGMVTHLAFYAGWPSAVSALNVVEQTFADRGIDASVQRDNDAVLPLPASDAERAKAVQERVGPVAPKLAQLTNDVLFGSLWQRRDLSPRDRSLITIAALAASGDGEQLALHVARGLDNGLAEREIGEAVTHLAFYAGWPKAMAATGTVQKVFEERRSSRPVSATRLQIIPAGEAMANGPAANFTGAVAVTSPFKGTGGARLGGGTVTFQPGAHTNWHTHPLGQLLIVTDGNGWVQVDGEPAKAIKAGDTVWIAPGTKHWHGAARSTPMTHVAVSEALDGTSVTWLEPMPDDQYDAL